MSRPRKRNLTIHERIEAIALWEKYGTRKAAEELGVSEQTIRNIVRRYKEGKIFAGRPSMDIETQQQILYLHWQHGWSAKRISNIDVVYPSHNTIQKLLTEHTYKNWFVFTDGLDLYIRHLPSRQTFFLPISDPPSDTRLPVRSWFNDRIKNGITSEEYQDLQKITYKILTKKANEELKKRFEKALKIARKLDKQITETEFRIRQLTGANFYFSPFWEKASRAISELILLLEGFAKNPERFSELEEEEK